MSKKGHAAWHRHMVGNYAPFGPVFTAGKGATLHDSKGRDYIDLAGGIAVLSLGHADKDLASAIAAQAKKLMHVSNHFEHELSVKTAKRLLGATGMEQVFFCNSGAEANECALKIARKRGIAIARGKHRVVSLAGGFHGRIGLSLAASNKKLWQSFGPQAAGFAQVDFSDEKTIRAAFDNRVCAVIAEPIQGESGVIPIPAAALRLLARLCAKHDALLILDEIQSGMGRTGKVLASDGLGLVPDIVTLGKGIGGGFPVAATLVANKATGVLQPGDHGTTYGGNPLALSAVDTVLRKVTKRSFLARVRKLGEVAMDTAREFRRSGAPVVEVRGKGLMVGIVLDTKKTTPAEVATRAMEEGVVVIPTAKDVIRLVPPLTIKAAELRKGLRRLANAMEAL